TYEQCLQAVEKCDIFILILDRRYGGSTNLPLNEKSITHLEFEQAIKLKKPFLCFIRDKVEGDYHIWKRKNYPQNGDDLQYLVGDKNWRVLQIVDEIQRAAPNGKALWRKTFTSSVDLKRNLDLELNRLKRDNIYLPGDIKLEMINIPASSKNTVSVIGSPTYEFGHTESEIEHKIKITKEFWLGKYPVTCLQWKTVMLSSPYDLATKAFEENIKNFLSRKSFREYYKINKKEDIDKILFNEDEDLPINFVSWYEALIFCKKLTFWEKQAGRLPDNYVYTLPTEAQWEYACRAGTKGTLLYNNEEFEQQGDNNAPCLDRIAWYGGNSGQNYTGKGHDTSSIQNKQYPEDTLAGLRRVGQKQPNPWGLYDMLGNIYEWCLDSCTRDSNSKLISTPTYGINPAKNTVIDPFCSIGDQRIMRGGCWGSIPTHCRPAYRNCHVPEYRADFIGFRVALAPNICPEYFKDI
nr:SUMF1/EgtB/PvdO family nonheme iron enzyme [Lentisphaeria bacterium]